MNPNRLSLLSRNGTAVTLDEHDLEMIETAVAHEGTRASIQAVMQNALEDGSGRNIESLQAILDEVDRRRDVAFDAELEAVFAKRPQPQLNVNPDVVEPFVGRSPPAKRRRGIPMGNVGDLAVR